MKKSKIFLVLLFFIISAVAIISCSQESSINHDVGANLISNIEALKLFYENDIRQSKEYDVYDKEVDKFISKLKGTMPNLDDRNRFNNWIAVNLSATDFGTIVNAMEEYDKMIDSGLALESKFSDFYKGLTDIQNDRDLLYVFEIELTPPPVLYNTTPCQDGCIGTVESNLDYSEMMYASFLSSSNPNKRNAAKAIYEELLTNSINTFNDCMNGCN